MSLTTLSYVFVIFRGFNCCLVYNEYSRQEVGGFSEKNKQIINLIKIINFNYLHEKMNVYLLVRLRQPPKK